MGWPNYYTAVLPVRIGKQKYMIQVWKGHCERVPDAVGDAITSDGIHFPGGVGAEVGIIAPEDAVHVFDVANGQAIRHGLHDQATAA